MQYVLIVFIIGFLIFVHELGHYLAARAIKIPIEIFSIGFGPKLWSWKRGSTEFRISWIPLGGYVLPALASEEDYFKIPVRQRFVFSLGGPLANLILPVFLFAIVNAMKSGISISGLFIKPWEQTVAHFMQILNTLPMLFTHPDKLSGVVGIVSQGGAFIGKNLSNGLMFTIIISLNLAVLNLLPIPGLDGGKIFMSLLEKIHPKAVRWQMPITVAGLALLFGLMIYVTVLDIQKFFI